VIISDEAPVTNATDVIGTPSETDVPMDEDVIGAEEVDATVEDVIASEEVDATVEDVIASEEVDRTATDEDAIASTASDEEVDATDVTTVAGANPS
jgi:hypothetical protein